MITFNLPLPSDVADNPFFYTRTIPQKIIEDVKSVWGNREFLPAGGFDALVTLPELTDTTKEEWESFARYVYKVLLCAGVLKKQPSSCGVRFAHGEALGVEVTMFQLLWPDGRPIELPLDGQNRVLDK